MKTPSEHGKPFSKTIKRTTKEVRMVMTHEQVEEALTTYLTKNFPQFRNMDIEFEYMEDLIEAVALRETADEI